MELRVVLPALLVCVFCLGNVASAKTRNVFYVLGSDGIYIIDPVEKKIVKKITNTTSPGLCAKKDDRRARNKCSLSQARVADGAVFVADGSGSAVHVIDIETQERVETIPTDPYPYGMQHLPWRKELWVHSWNLSTFDVIKTESRNRTHKAIRAHVKPGWTHGTMLADKDMNEGKTAYVTHFKNPGIHELNLETKSYTRFINFTSYNCSGTYGIAYNSYSGYLYVDCVRDYRSISLIQMSIKSSVFINWGFAGSPLVSPNGRYVVVLYRSKTNSRMKILAVKKPTSTEDLGDISIPGGVSHAVFYPKGKNPDSYYAFVTLDYSNKMAVVDFDLVKNGSSPVTYIENVGELDTSRHGASRDLFISGKWIISPATKSKTVVIIDAEARKVHGKVSDVNEGDFAVWVPGMGPSSGTSGMSTGPSGTSGIAGMAGSRSLFVFLFGFLLLSN